MKDLVWVFLYRYWDEDAQCHRSSSLYATEELIRSGLGQPIHATATQVERAALKDRGFYIPADATSASNEDVA